MPVEISVEISVEMSVEISVEMSVGTHSGVVRGARRRRADALYVRAGDARLDVADPGVLAPGAKRPALSSP